ncbi:unnamed protein product, partial [Musa acuminata var. zebrina]
FRVRCGRRLPGGSRCEAQGAGLCRVRIVPSRLLNFPFGSSPHRRLSGGSCCGAQ